MTGTDGLLDTIDAIISDNVYIDNDGVAGISAAAEAILAAVAPRCEVLNDDARHVKSALETLCDPLLIKVPGHLVGTARAMAIIDGMREIAQRALLRLPDAIAPSFVDPAQASVTRDEIAKIIAPDWFDQYSHCLNNYENQHIRFQNDALERADKIMALLGLSVPSAQCDGRQMTDPNIPTDPVKAFAYLVSKCASGLYLELVDAGRTDTNARNQIIFMFLDFAAGEACRVARREGREPRFDKWAAATTDAFERAIKRTAAKEAADEAIALTSTHPGTPR